MNLQIDQNSAPKYFKSQSRISGIISEFWAGQNLYCLKCGSQLSSFPQNSRVNDFFCSICGEKYQLKSSRSSFRTKAKGAAYHLLAEAIKGRNQPNYFLLHYNFRRLLVKNVIFIPKEFISLECVEKRKALPLTARRAGWVGCNILLKMIPDKVKIFLIKDEQIIPKHVVLEEYIKVLPKPKVLV